MKNVYCILFFLLSLDTCYLRSHNEQSLFKRDMHCQCADILGDNYLETNLMSGYTDWKISSFLKAGEICSEITSLMDFSVEMRLVSDAVTGAGSTIFQWCTMEVFQNR